MRRLSLGMRGIAIAILVASAFVPDLDRPSSRQSLALVLDESFSVGANHMGHAFLAELREQALSAQVELNVVRVADRAVLERNVHGSEADPTDFIANAGSVLEDGVRLAIAALPDEGSRRIVVATDGRGTRGDLRAAVEDAASRGIAVDFIGVGEAPLERTRLGAMSAVQSRVAEGESVELEVEVQGQPHERVLVEHYRDRAAIGARWTTLDADGRATVRHAESQAGSGMHVFEAQILAASGERFDRTRSKTAVLVMGKPKVLVVTLFGDQPTLLVDAIRQSEAEVEHLQLTDGRLEADRLSEVDLVVLSDLPLERAGEVSLVSGLSTQAQDALVEYVRDQGGGLVATGGAFGFGPDYADTSLARILPIRIEDQGEVDDPPVAMAVMLDRSGSMGARVGTHTKMELAVEASLAAAATLRGTDRIAIAAVDVASRWSQRLAPASELGARRDDVRSIRAGGGGIYVFTALADAYRELAEAHEPIRHVLLFSDTADSEEQHQGCPFRPCRSTLPWAVDFARDARTAGITTSVVGIGQARDPDTRFLQELAVAGGGRFYLTTRGADLRRIFVTETRAAALSNLREEPMGVRRADPSPMIQGIGDVPTLSGFVQSQVRSTADTALVTAEGQPLLASWRYGLGTVVALTTDAGGRWTQSWNDWPGAGQMMRQIVRFAQRRRAATRADVELWLEGDQVVVRVDVPLGEATPERLELFAYGPDGEAKRLDASLERVAPGRWEARARANDAHTTVAMARVRDDQGRLLGEEVAEQTAVGELAQLGLDGALLDSLAALAEGRRDPEVQDVLAPAPRSAPVPMPVWPYLLVLAAILVVLDVWLRRFEKRRHVDLSALMPRSTPTAADDPSEELPRAA